jgi:AcrR family transcriptional regulator
MKSKNKAMEERVLKSAQNFISSYGVKGWSMDDLASAAGITKRTLYKIISSKEQLVHDIVFSEIKENAEAFVQILQTGPDFDEYIKLIIFKIPELLKNSYINRYKDILHEYPDIEAGLIHENEKVKNHMTEFFQIGIDRGYLRKDMNPELMNNMLAAIMIFFVKYSDSQEDATEKIHEALRYMLHGCINSDELRI